MGVCVCGGGVIYLLFSVWRSLLRFVRSLLSILLLLFLLLLLQKKTWDLLVVVVEGGDVGMLS